MRDIKNKFVKLCGKVGVENSYSYGDEILIKAVVVQVIGSDNQDGSIDQTYQAKALIVE